MNRRILRIILATFVISLPVIVVSVWLAIRFDATLLDHAPFWNDELYHWHQSATFAEAGFNGGYYAFDDNVPIAEFSHFYAWGAWPYVLYGTIGRLFGFALHTIMLINLALFVAASIFFLMILRPNYWHLLLFGAVLATFVPLLIYLPSSMLQVLNLAIAIVFAGGFTILLHRTVSWRFLLGLSIFAAIAGLIRPTYALFLFPILVLAEEKRTLKTIFLAGLKALPLILLAVLGFYFTTAPYPLFRTLLFLGDDALLTKLGNFAAYIQQSLLWLTVGESVAIAQRLQIGLLLILLLIWGIYQWHEKKEGAWRWELTLHLYNLLGFYVAAILFHETLGSHDYRVMSPHLFFSLLLLVAFRRRWIVGLMLTSMLMAMPAAWEQYQWKAPNFNGEVQQQWHDWEGETAVLHYNPDAPSAWCNTVTTSAYYVLDPAGQPGMLLSIEAGMGLSWVYDWVFPDFEIEIPERYRVPQSFQARYLILTDADSDLWQDRLNLRQIGNAPNGGIYVNRDVRC
jgi:hypothetical protein